MQNEPRLGCGAAIVVDGRLLLVQRRTDPEAGCWGLPGGKVDLFEPAADAVRREIAEEVGIAIDPVDLLCVVDQIDRATGMHWLSPVYRVDRYQGEPVNHEPGKHAAIGWFALDALPASLTTPTRTAIAALARRAGGPSDQKPNP